MRISLGFVTFLKTRRTCFGVSVHRTLDYPTINSNPCLTKCTALSQCMPGSDRHKDEHHGNSVTIRSNECIVR